MQTFFFTCIVKSRKSYASAQFHKFLVNTESS